MIVRADGRRVGFLCTNILEGRISFRSKLLAIFKVRKGYVIGVSPSFQIVIHPKGHADAFLRLHDHVLAHIPHQYLSWPDGGSSIDVPSGSTRKSGGSTPPTDPAAPSPPHHNSPPLTKPILPPGQTNTNPPPCSPPTPAPFS